MSAKPEDRRAIFEEATGISKFKSRKNESERKLERTHENIVRYSDILSEIENQLGPLERQSEKAREFNELSTELKHHELNTYMAKVDGVESAKGKIYTRIKGIEEATNLRQSEMDKAQSEYEKIFSDIEDADIRLKKLNDELLEKRVNMEKSSGAKQLFEQRLSFINGQIERAEKEIEENENLIADCKKSFSTNQAELSDCDKELSEVFNKSERIRKKLVSVSEKITLGEELASANQKKVIESIESLTDLKVNKGTMSIAKSNLLDKLSELTEKLDKLSVKREGQFNEKERADNTINDLDRAVYELKNKIADKENEVRESNEKVAGVDNAIYSLNSIITTLVTKDNFYRGLKDNYEGYMPSVKLLLNKAKENGELKRRIKGVVAELIKSDKKYDIALETALAAAAQNVVTATPDDAKYLIEYLKQNKIGRITFLPITSVKPREQSTSVTSALNELGALGVANELVTYDKQYENIISNLLGNTLIVDTLEHATRIADKYRFAFYKLLQAALSVIGIKSAV
jgi:chromosome segregation protein